MNQPIIPSTVTGSLLVVLSTLLTGCSIDASKKQLYPEARQQTPVSTPSTKQPSKTSYLGYAASGHLEHAYADARDDAQSAEVSANQCTAASIQRIFGVWEPASGTMRITMLLEPLEQADTAAPTGTLQRQLAHHIAAYEGTHRQPNRITLLELCPTDQDAHRYTGRAPTLDLQTAFENAVVRALPSRHSARDPLHFVVCSIAATDGSVQGMPDAIVTIEVETP